MRRASGISGFAPWQLAELRDPPGRLAASRASTRGPNEKNEKRPSHITTLSSLGVSDHGLRSDLGLRYSRPRPYAPGISMSK